MAETPRPEVLWAPAQVADASDRAYEPTAIGLIDRAQHSVVLSLYLLRESEDARHPVNRLLKDLLEAAQRGVRVEIYLNTRFKGGDSEKILETPALKRLKEAGIQITGLPSSRRLHDKLLIVDERWILEGSTNWSVEALKTNWESNTLIDSPSLAKQKLHRLRQLVEKPATPAPGTHENPSLPRTVEIPSAWIAKGGTLTRLVSSRDERVFDTLLLLFLEAAAQGRSDFFMNLEEMGLDLGLPEEWDDTATRRQVIKVLRKLQNTAGFGLELSFTHGKDAWVKLALPEGPALTVPTDLIEPAKIARISAAATYLKLFGFSLKKQEGLELTQFTLKELSRRTGLSASVINRARWELADV